MSEEEQPVRIRVEMGTDEQGQPVPRRAFVDGEEIKLVKIERITDGGWRAYTRAWQIFGAIMVLQGCLVLLFAGNNWSRATGIFIIVGWSVCMMVWGRTWRSVLARMMQCDQPERVGFRYWSLLVLPVAIQSLSLVTSVST